MRKVLILFGHPAIHKSRVHRQLVREVKTLPSVTFHDLYEHYPDHFIDVEAEKKLLLDHDVVILEHPFYWYSTPSIFKEWADLVLEYGFAYGPGGTALEGKKWVHAMSTGGHATAYHREGSNRFTIREFLAPWEQTANLCGMEFLEPFVIHGSMQLNPETEIPQTAQKYRQWVEVLCRG